MVFNWEQLSRMIKREYIAISIRDGALTSLGGGALSHHEEVHLVPPTRTYGE
jgi:hypothetical protein